MAPEPVGVLVMAYGTPASPQEVEAYYTHVRRGRPPTPELLADLRRRYDAIGGLSPLLDRTTEQVAGVQSALGDAFLVTLGQKHAAPFVEDGMAHLLAAGVRGVVGLALAPHHSALSVGEYHERAAAGRGSTPYLGVRPWHLHPTLVDLLAERVTEALGRFPASARVETLVSAHSLPERARHLDDPSYPDQLRQTAEAVVGKAGVDHWRLAWQSAGRTPEPWIGPDILEVVRALAAEGVEGVVVCPAGFVSDHLEVLYDIDVEARGVAEQAGLRLERTAALNDDPRFLAMLAELVADAAERLP
ncbi:MAG: ferrochelatase [Actinomycetota bacterium]|nr:ferrochelatase [Actinomycetota bacterium]